MTQSALFVAPDEHRYRNWIPCPDRPAVFSTDRKRRYELARVRRDAVGSGRALGVVGVNPSKASETAWDQTIKKLTRFCDAWGFQRLVMTNLFPFVSTYPKDLLCDEAVGAPDDVERVVASLAAVDLVLCAWGGPYSPKALGDRIAKRAREVEAALRSAGRDLHVLGFSDDGIPRHALFMSESLKPTIWEARA
jgi:hypothetical protein